MSNTNGYNSLTKSMNGIITISDGMGGTMEDGVVSCTELECPRINVDEIESKTAGANVSLFTELVGGSIHLANGATTLFVDAPATIVTANVSNLNATNISTNNIVSAATGTAVNLFTNQTTGVINFATGRTTGNVIMGSNTATGSFNIRNAGITNLGAFSSTLNLGTSQTALQIVNVGNLGVTNINGSAVNVSAILNTNTINSLNTALPSSLFANALTDVSIADGLITGILSMGSLLQVGDINIGGSNQFGGSINIGREMLNGIIRIASNCVNTSIYFGNDGNSGTVNFNTNTTLNLGPYSKIINIGTNQFNATDRINIGNNLTGSAGMNINSKGTINMGLNASAIQIGNTMLFGGVGINIGNSAVLTNINGSTLNVGDNATTINMGTAMTTAGSSVNIGTNTMTTNLKGVAINLGTDTGIANTITIGNASSTVNINGSAITFNNPIIGNTYTATANNSAVTLFSNVTTGSILIGGGLTTGVINLGPSNLNADILSNCPHQFNKGISFQNSNVQNDKIITGSITATSAVGASATATQTHTYTNSYTFGSAPRIMAQVSSATISCQVIVMTRNITTTGFTTVVRNVTPSAVTANSYSIDYLAIGDI